MGTTLNSGDIEILSLFGLQEYHFDDEDIEVTLSSQIADSVQSSVRKSSEQNVDILRAILHDAGFDGFDDKILGTNLETIVERDSVTQNSSPNQGCNSPQAQLYPPLQLLPPPKLLPPTVSCQLPPRLPEIVEDAKTKNTRVRCSCFGENGLRSLFFRQGKVKKE